MPGQYKGADDHNVSKGNCWIQVGLKDDMPFLVDVGHIVVVLMLFLRVTDEPAAADGPQG